MGNNPPFIKNKNMKMKLTSQKAVISAIIAILLAILSGTSACSSLFPFMSTVLRNDSIILIYK